MCVNYGGTYRLAVPGGILWIQLLTTHRHPFCPHCARKLRVMAHSLTHVLSQPCRAQHPIAICSVLTLKMPLCSFLGVVAEFLAIIMSHSNHGAARLESVFAFQSSSGCVLVLMETLGALGELYDEALTLVSLGLTGSACVWEMLLIRVMWRWHKMHRTDMIPGFGVLFKILFYLLDSWQLYIYV